jgi:S-DNA-T family DNA segregation ATPase FtsK/SpoIIIE
VSGQSPDRISDRAANLAHGLGVMSCRVRTGRPGSVVLELVRSDALAAVIPALPIPIMTDLRALPVGRREDGGLLEIRLHGTHLLIAGATGAGKGSWLWGLIRAMIPAMRAGLVNVHACDPKLMELAYGRGLFAVRLLCGRTGSDRRPPGSRRRRDAGTGRAVRRAAARPHAHNRSPVRGGRGR